MKATPSGRIEAHGQQIKLDGKHLADCRDPEAALALRDALEYSGFGFSEIPTDAVENILRVLL